MQALFGRKKSTNSAVKEDNHARKKGASLPPLGLAPPENTRSRPSSASSYTVAGNSTASVDLNGNTEELQLSYGYWGIEFNRELTTTQVQYVVDLVGRQLKERGLEVSMQPLQ